MTQMTSSALSYSEVAHSATGRRLALISLCCFICASFALCSFSVLLKFWMSNRPFMLNYGAGKTTQAFAAVDSVRGPLHTD